MNMSDLALRTTGLGKMYYIGSGRQGYRTLRETLMDAVKRPIERIRHPGAATHVSEELWALRDITIELHRGEALGIVGRNGSGKSTLLKVLSRITEPSEGRAEVWGRVGSLLEVGTGFHSELTGRENIYLSGAILGMTRAEIKARFDEITEFSEVGRFLDTPVKRYSSGMYVRLAFAVAAHLDPDILIVDEVLAVGDAEFQKKCLGRMDEVAGQGRTVLFVSHNMAAVRNLCTRAIQLEAGRVVRTGSAMEVTQAYLEGSLTAGTKESIKEALAALPETPGYRLLDVTVSQDGVPARQVLSGRPIDIEFRWVVDRPLRGVRAFFDLVDDNHNLLFRSHHDDEETVVPLTEPGEYVSVATVPADLLAARPYNIRVSLHFGRWNESSGEGEGILIPIEVETSGAINAVYQDKKRWKLEPRIPWQTTRVAAGAPGEQQS